MLGDTQRFHHNYCVLGYFDFYILVDAFGEFIDGGVHFRTLKDKLFLYDTLTFVCGGSYNDTIQWIFSNESHFSKSEMLTTFVTYSNTEFSFSILSADVNGYFRCMVDGTINHTVGLYNQSTKGK